MTYKELRKTIASDAFRYNKAKIFKLYFSTPGFKYTFWMRLCLYLRGRKGMLILYSIALLILRRYSILYGIQIPFITKIGDGFYIGHFNDIVVSPLAIIGKNVNISNGVTIGQTTRGSRIGVPTIGNEVYIAPGAKIIGNIRVGNNVAIGANAVVTKDVPDNAVVVGIPARIISFNGSATYISCKVT